MSKCDEFTIQRCGRKEQCAAQAAALRELEAERDRLREALLEIANRGTPVQKEEHRIARAALEGK